MTQLTATEILRRNRQAAQKAVEEVGAAKLRKLLERAQRDLAERVCQAEGLKGPGAGSFTAAQARAVLRQVEDVLRNLKTGMKGVAVEQAIRASERQTASVLKYLQDGERLFTGVATPLEIADAAVYDHVRQGAESSVLRRIATDPAHPGNRGVLDRYGDQVIEHFETELQQRVLVKADWSDVRQKLVDGSPFLQKAPAHWAERIIRTESMAASNRASLEAIQVAETSLGDVVKILSAVFDNRTASDSFDVHGQIRRTSEPFNDWFGRSYMHPPNRPNDREVVIPHRMSWPIPPALQRKSDSACAAAWAREGRTRPMPSRSKHSTVDLKLFGQGAAGGGSAGFTPPATGSAPKPAVGAAPPAPPPPRPAPPTRTRFIEPTVDIRRGPDGDATFHTPSGTRLRLHGDEQTAVDTLLGHGSDKELGRWVTGDAKPDVDESRPYEAELARVVGDLQAATTRHARAKKMKLEDVKRLTFETAELDRETAARLAAELPRDAPVIVKFDGKHYLPGGNAEHLAAHIATEKAKNPTATKVQVRFIDLDKEKRPARPAKEWAASSAGTYKKLGEGKGATPAERAKVRDDLRELLRAQGIASRDDEPDERELSFTTNAGSLDVRASIPGAYGFHDWSGNVVVRTDVAKGAAGALEAIAKEGEAFKARPIVVQNAILSKLNTFVHEELHGASPIQASAYHGPGVGMEEAATEILSRKATRELVGHAAPTGQTALGLPTKKPDGGYRADVGEGAAYFGSYNGYIGALLRQTGEVIGHDGVHTKVEAALVKTRSREIQARWITPREHIAAYADALGLSGAKHAELVDRLLRELPKGS